MYLLISLTTPVPERRRVWQQAVALARRGHRVRVVSPRKGGQARFEIIDGVEIERFTLPIEGKSRLGLLAESLALLALLASTLFRHAVVGRVRAIQLTNPPDWSVAVAAVIRRPGTAIVFDAADMTPPLYESKFHARDSVFHLVRALFLFALWRADLVLTPNDLYRRYATRVSGRSPEVTIRVASFPERIQPLSGLRAPGPIRIGYFGILGTHEGVESLIRAASILRAMEHVPPFSVEIVGDGPARSGLAALARQCGVCSVTHFHGFLREGALERALQTFDLAVIPDPLSAYAHGISMNKVFVFASLGMPVVTTPLRQTRRLLGDAAMYAKSDTPRALAAAIAPLLDDSIRLIALGQLMRERSIAAFSCPDELERYVSAIEALDSARAA